MIAKTAPGAGGRSLLRRLLAARSGGRRFGAGAAVASALMVAVGALAAGAPAPASAATSPSAARLTSAAVSSGGASSRPQGYWLAGADGGVFSFGGVAFHGSAGGTGLAAPVVGSAATRDGGGYWLVGADGGVLSFGDATFHGSAAGMRLGAPIVGMAADPATGGYWLVGADGGVLSFGAPFYGSAAGIALHGPIVGMAAAPDGHGYWLVGADGGVLSFGDVTFHGSAAGMRLGAPIVGMAADPATGGYWLVGADGGVLSFGAPFYGSAAGMALVAPVVGMAALPNGAGYRLAARDGGVFDFGAAGFAGSTGGLRLNASIVGLANGAGTAPPPPPLAPAAVTSGGTAHVMVIAMENHDYGEIIGSPQAPYINSLASRYANLTQSYARTHPSLPNYLELISGSTQGISTDCGPGPGCQATAGAQTVANQLDARGIPWKAYMESATSSCAKSDQGGYAVRHDPFVYFPSLAGDCASHVVSLDAMLPDLNSSAPPDFVWVSPNVTDDMHDGSIAQGDAWLASEIPAIQSTAWYRDGGRIVVTWDEGDQSSATCCNAQAQGGQIPTIVVSAAAAGAGNVAMPVDHAGLLATIEDDYGLAHLGSAADPASGFVFSLLFG